MISRYPVYRDRLNAEWSVVRRAAEKAILALESPHRNNEDLTVYLDSAALNLHGFYNGLERIFEWLARQLDNTIPKGPSWHRDLLTQMSLTVEGVRPAVVRPKTKDALEEFLGFRHLVRNTYTWGMDAEKIGDLVGRMPGLPKMLETDFDRFKLFLDSASHADDADS